jgi:hypothetical protein
MKIPWFRGGAALATACAAFAVAAGNAAATPALRLLATYQPVTQLDPLESFRPSSVQSFIADASLEQLAAPGTWSVVDPDPEPGALPGADAGVFRLNQDSCTPSAPLGGLACYAASADEGSGGPVVYGRVAHEDDRIVLQYWYFYYDDVYSYRYPPSDFSERLGPPGIDGPATPIHKIGGNGAPWLDFAGFWGELQYFHAPIGTFALGTSPVGPAFHTVWVDPLGTLATWTAS